MFCAKFGWNWPSCSGKKDFKILSMYFLLFCNYLPLKKGGDVHLNKIESLSPNDALWQVWLELAQWFWRKRFFNFVNVFSLVCYYLPLEKVGPFIWTNLIPLHPRMHSAKFGWNWPSGSGEEDGNVKCLRQRQQQHRQRQQWQRQKTDKFWSE